jgi:alpha-glucosidase (family GH31 glycosyl hydrolase)
LERKGKNNEIKSEEIKDVRMIITFSKTKAKIDIRAKPKGDPKTNEQYWEIPENLYDSNDFEMKDGRVSSISESLIGIKILNHPFGFYLFRKDTGERLFDTTHSTESTNFNLYFYFAKNFMQISTRLPSKHYTYGLGERWSSLRLKKGKYVLWASDPNLGGPVEKENTLNSYSSMPSFITVNPTSLTAYGALMLCSSPMEVMVDDNFLTYKMISNIMELYVFYGPRPKEVIIQYQRLTGLPILAPFDALNWQASIITSNPARDVQYILDILNKNTTISQNFASYSIDFSDTVNEKTYDNINPLIEELSSLGYTVNGFRRSPISKTSNLYEQTKNSSLCLTYDNKVLEGKTSYGDVCFLDYFNTNSMDIIRMEVNSKHAQPFNRSQNQMTLLLNEPYQLCNGVCDPNIQQKTVTLPYHIGDKSFSLEKNTLPITLTQTGGENFSMLNTHNIYALQEVKTYYTALKDRNIERPLIFSRTVFPGSQQYAGKWLGYIKDTWEGFKLAIIQTMNFNVFIKKI